MGLTLDLAVVTASLATLVLAELCDKTQIAAIALASRGSPLKVFAGSSLGFILANVLMIALGGWLYSALPAELIRVASGILFIATGILTLRVSEKVVSPGEGGFLQALSLVGIMELGDKTNLATLALAASTGAPLEVLIGLIIAALLLMGLAVAAGSALARALSPQKVKLVASAILIGIGAALLVEPLLRSMA